MLYTGFETHVSSLNWYPSLHLVFYHRLLQICGSLDRTWNLGAGIVQELLLGSSLGRVV
ncbi:MAG: hypothetical protein O7G88_12525 [bacterium]|nr:hypothetical protein [bacterium]